MDPAGLVASFRTRFGTAPRLFRAPGRVNLIGEHNLVREEAVAAFRDAVTRRYRTQTGIAAEVYVCRATAGAGDVAVGR